jgi:hypothetical protein
MLYADSQRSLPSGVAVYGTGSRPNLDFRKSVRRLGSTSVRIVYPSPLRDVTSRTTDAVYNPGTYGKGIMRSIYSSLLLSGLIFVESR